MREYEGIVIIDPEKEGSLKEVLEGIASLIKKENGKVEKEENWGKQKMPHPIKKKTEGVYCKLAFSVNPSAIRELRSSYKLNPNILRIMITKK